MKLWSPLANSLPLLGTERQQHVSGNASVARIPGADKYHAVDYHGAWTGDRAAAAFYAVDRFEIAHGIEIPQQLAIFGGVRPNMSIGGGRKYHAWNLRHRARLGGTAAHGRAFRTR